MDINAFFISLLMVAIIPAWITSERNIPSEAMELQGDSPKILDSPEYYEAYVGDRVMLDCVVEDLEEHTVIWRKATESKPLTVGHESFLEDGRIVAKHIPKERKWNLVIKRVRLTDNGMYECQVSSTLRHLRRYVLLSVKEREQTTQHKSDITLKGSAYVEKNGRLYLICNATGLDQAPDDLDWFKDGNKLPESDDGRVLIRKDVSLTSRTIISTLEIEEARTSDMGNYVCRTSTMQIHNLMVTVLNADTSNVKRESLPAGTPPENREKKSQDPPRCRNTDGTPCDPSPAYSRPNTGGHGPGGTATALSTSYLRLFVINILVIVVSQSYRLFPS